MKRSLTILAIALIFSCFSGKCPAENIDIHGFISQGYLKTTNNNFFGDTQDGSFKFNEFGINFSDELTDQLHVGLQILARDFGSNGNDEMAIDWAFGDYRWRDWLGIRAGKIKAPKGLYNETRDVDMLRTSIFLPQSVYPEILRDMDLGLLGAGIYGHFDLNFVGLLSYQFVYGTQNVDPNEAASQALQATTAYNTPLENDSIDVNHKFALGLVWDTPLNGLRLGATYDRSDLLATAHVLTVIPGAGKGDTVYADFKKFENSVYSAEYTFGNLLVSAEYIRTDRDFGLGFREMPNLYMKMTSDGWYLGSSYEFFEWFGLGGYYSESYNNTKDRDGKHIDRGAGNDNPNRAYFKDLCLTARFSVNEYWSFKLEGHRLKGTNGVSPLDQVPDSNGEVFAKENWNLFAAKVNFSF